MTNPLSKALFDATTAGKPVLMAQVTITATTPLTITFNGTPGILAAPKWTGSSYVLGPATAIYTNPGIPIVLPNA